MAKMTIIPQGFDMSKIEATHGFNRPDHLSGRISKIELFEAKSGSGKYCKISIESTENFLVREEQALSAGLPIDAKPNEYYLEPGSVLRIRKFQMY